MTTERANGVALLGGAVAMLLTMAFHPTGHDLHGAGAGHGAFMSRAVHALAVVSTAFTMFGTLGLWRRLRTAAPSLADFGLVAFALGTAAAVQAAMQSGFVTTRLALAMHRAPSEEKEALHGAVDHSFYVNQSCALLYVVASSVAIAAWSLAGWRGRALPRHLAGYGLLMSLLIAALTFAGHLRFDVHGFGAVVLGQALWTIGCGVLLLRPART